MRAVITGARHFRSFIHIQIAADMKDVSDGGYLLTVYGDRGLGMNVLRYWQKSSKFEETVEFDDIFERDSLMHWIIINVYHNGLRRSSMFIPIDKASIKTSTTECRICHTFRGMIYATINASEDLVHQMNDNDRNFIDSTYINARIKSLTKTASRQSRRLVMESNHIARKMPIQAMLYIPSTFTVNSNFMLECFRVLKLTLTKYALDPQKVWKLLISLYTTRSIEYKNDPSEIEGVAGDEHQLPYDHLTGDCEDLAFSVAHFHKALIAMQSSDPLLSKCISIARMHVVEPIVCQLDVGHGRAREWIDHIMAVAIPIDGDKVMMRGWTVIEATDATLFAPLEIISTSGPEVYSHDYRLKEPKYQKFIQVIIRGEMFFILKRDGMQQGVSLNDLASGNFSLEKISADNPWQHAEMVKHNSRLLPIPPCFNEGTYQDIRPRRDIATTSSFNKLTNEYSKRKDSKYISEILGIFN